MPIAESTIIEDRYLEVEVRPKKASELVASCLGRGDSVDFSTAPVKPEAVTFEVRGSRVSRSTGNLQVRLLPEGPHGEEARICTQKVLQAKCYAALDAEDGEFVARCHLFVWGLDQLKLVVADNAKYFKNRLHKGRHLSIREGPCGIEHWTVVEANVQDSHGTHTLVRPKAQPAQGFFFVSERTLAIGATLRLVRRYLAPADNPFQRTLPAAATKDETVHAEGDCAIDMDAGLAGASSAMQGRDDSSMSPLEQVQLPPRTSCSRLGIFDSKDGQSSPPFSAATLPRETVKQPAHVSVTLRPRTKLPSDSSSKATRPRSSLPTTSPFPSRRHQVSSSRNSLPRAPSVSRCSKQLYTEATSQRSPSRSLRSYRRSELRRQSSRSRSSHRHALMRSSTRTRRGRTSRAVDDMTDEELSARNDGGRTSSHDIQSRRMQWFPSRERNAEGSRSQAAMAWDREVCDTRLRDVIYRDGESVRSQWEDPEDLRQHRRHMTYQSGARIEHRSRP